MTGGNYFTSFRDEGSETRKILYFLEELGIVSIRTRKLKESPNPEFDKDSVKRVKEISKTVKDKHLKKLFNEWEPSWREYRWILTSKGKKIVEKDENLQKLQKERDALRFFKALKDKVEEKHFFVP